MSVYIISLYAKPNYNSSVSLKFYIAVYGHKNVQFNKKYQNFHH